MLRINNQPASYERVDWERFLSRFRWSQGEHVAVIAPTGGGKSTLLSRILPKRRHVVVLVTKTFDPVFQREYLAQGYARIHEWPPKPWQEKVLLWPVSGKTIRETIGIQRATFRRALDAIFQERGWCVVFDEQHYLSQSLGLAPENAMFLHQGRSSGLSVVNGIQRPAWVPVVTYSGSSHAFVWRTTDATDLRRLANLGGIDSRRVAATMAELSRYEFLYINTRSERPPVVSQVKLSR